MFEKYELFLSRIPIFLLGILIVRRINNNREINFSKMFLIVLIALFAYHFSMKTEYLILKRYSEGILSICIMIIYAFIRNFGVLKKLGSVFSFLGGISLEIYMVHVLVFFEFLNFIVGWDLFPEPVWYVIVPLISIPLAKIVSLLANRVVLCIEKEKKH